MNINVCVLSGRLTKAVELRATGSGTSVASFTVAVDDGWGDKKKTYFLPVIVWQKAAEACAKSLVKGQMVTVKGRITTRNWDDQQGQRHYVTEIVADNVEFGMRPKNAQTREAQAHGAQEESSHAASLPYEAPPVPDEEVPF